jgi:hypothetical protein
MGVPKFSFLQKLRQPAGTSSMERFPTLSYEGLLKVN